MAVIYIYFARLINNRLADRNLSTMTEVYEILKNTRSTRRISLEEKRAHLTEKMAGLKELLINTGAEIERKCPDGEIYLFRAGGGRPWLYAPGLNQQLCQFFSAVSNAGVPHTILGNRTNTLFRDSGYQGVVIRLGMDPSYIEEVRRRQRKDGEKFISGAVRLCCCHPLHGISWTGV